MRAPDMNIAGIAGKVAIVTGASRGIGGAIAQDLAEAGAHVIGTATTTTGADSVTDALHGAGDGDHQGHVLNVADEESISQFFAAIKDRDAPLILVNNAGITRDNIAMRMKPEEWDDVIGTNLTAVQRMCRQCFRGMTKARWGRIINISSVVGSMGNPGQSNYAAAKSGIEGFSRALAVELGSRDITVNCVAPGFIGTDMTAEIPEEQRNALLERVPLGRLGDPAEVAGIVRFLASDAAAYVTGETVHVNGGMYMA